MKFVFDESDADIGRYDVILKDGDETLGTVRIIDNTCEYRQSFDRKNNYRREFSFEVSYCSGWSMSHGFDCDYKCGNRKTGGYQGNCTHTLEDVKRWCEEFLANLFIIDYDKELEKLKERKKRSDWFIKNGYTGEYEGLRTL